MRVCQSKVRIQMRGRVTNAKWKAENEKRETATRLLGVETSLARRTHSSNKGKEGSGNSLYTQFTRPFPFLQKWVWLARLG